MLECKISTILTVLLALWKMFEYLKIVKACSYIVTMILVVALDIRVFMLFFIVMLVFFSMVFNVISRNPAPEYREISYFWANLLNVLRLAMGDFQFNLLDENEEDPRKSLNYK